MTCSKCNFDKELVRGNRCRDCLRDYQREQNHKTGKSKVYKGEPHNNLLGKKFGWLTVVANCGTRLCGRRKKPKRFWKVECKCGKEKEIEQTSLIRKSYPIVSCGCQQYKTGSENPKWDGHGEISGTVWNQIKRHSGVGNDKRNSRQEIEFTLTIEHIWKLYENQEAKCCLTGLPIGFSKPRTASLDRIDSNKGYVIGNIQWVHRDVNWMKGQYDLNKFIEMCKLVAVHAAGGSCSI